MQTQTEGAAPSRKPKRKPAKKKPSTKPRPKASSAELRYVSIASIDANPWRDLEKFPYLDGKLATLVASIDDVGFWEGIIAREVGDRYQIAFGHHRIEAARRCKLDTVPIIVRSLSDEDMVRFLARENMRDYSGDFRVHLATWDAGRKYLEAHDIEATPTTIARLVGWIEPAQRKAGKPKTNTKGTSAPNKRSGAVSDSHEAKACIGVSKLIERGLVQVSDLEGCGVKAVKEGATRALSRIGIIDASKDHTAAQKKKAVEKVGGAYRSALEDVREGRIKSSMTGPTVDRISSIESKQRPSLSSYIRKMRNLVRGIGAGALDEHVQLLTEGLHGATVDVLERELLVEVDDEFTQAIERLQKLQKQYRDNVDLTDDEENVIEIEEARSALGRGR